MASNSNVTAMSGVLLQIRTEHQAAGHVLHRQGGTDADTIACLLRAQLLMTEILDRLVSELK